jgi:hypothetical protein
MAEQFGAGAPASFHARDAEHPFQRRVDLQHVAAIVQDHDAFDHRCEHGKQLGAVFREFVDLGMQLACHVIQRRGQDADFILRGCSNRDRLMARTELSGSRCDVRERSGYAVSQPDTKYQGNEEGDSKCEKQALFQF